jgi:hypothetical protein
MPKITEPLSEGSYPPEPYSAYPTVKHPDYKFDHFVQISELRDHIVVRVKGFKTQDDECLNVLKVFEAQERFIVQACDIIQACGKAQYGVIDFEAQYDDIDFKAQYDVIDFKAQDDECLNVLKVFETQERFIDFKAQYDSVFNVQDAIVFTVVIAIDGALKGIGTKVGLKGIETDGATKGIDTKVSLKIGPHGDLVMPNYQAAAA